MATSSSFSRPTTSTEFSGTVHVRSIVTGRPVREHELVCSRIQAWKVRSMRLTVEDLKSKIKSIRSRYGAELGKIRRSETSGAGVHDVYKPRLFCFAQADPFLRTVTQPRDSSSNLPVSSNDATNEQAIVTSSGRSRSPFVRVRSEESLRFY